MFAGKQKEFQEYRILSKYFQADSLEEIGVFSPRVVDFRVPQEYARRILNTSILFWKFTAFPMSPRRTSTVKRLSLFLMFTLALAMSLTPAQAQTSAEPVLVVSISGVESVTEAVQGVATAAGFEQEVGMMIPMILDGADKAGLDVQQPWGVVVTLDGETPSGYAFVPIDFATVLPLLTEQLEGLKGMLAMGMELPVPIDPRAIAALEIGELDADGICTITAQNGEAIYLGGPTGWTIASTDRDAILNAPTDLSAVLGELPAKYAIGAALYPQRIPEELIDQLSGLAMMSMGSAQLPPEMMAQQQEQLEKAITQLKDAAQDIEEITFGIALGSDGSITIGNDWALVAGSDFDNALSVPASTPTRFSGFCNPDAILCFNQKQGLLPAQVSDMTTQLGTFRQEAIASLADAQLSVADRLILEKLVNDVIDAMIASLEQDVIEIAGAINAAPDVVSLALAASTPEAAKIEASVIELIGLAGQEMPEMLNMVTFNADEYNGIRMHSITVPAAMLVPQGGTPMQTMMLSQDGLPPALANGTLTVILGFSDDAVYLVASMGDSIAELKAAIDASETATVDPSVLQTMNISMAQLGEIFNLAEMPIDMILPGYEPSAEDSINSSLTYADSKAHMELVVSAGMVSLISQGVQAAMNMSGGSDSDFGPGFDEGFDSPDPFDDGDDSIDPFAI